MENQTADSHDLIAGCKRGETGAKKYLYERFAPAMMGICVRYINNRDTAKDLLQEGFIKVFTKIDSYSGAGSLEGWMRRIFVTTALEYLRSNQSLHFVTLDEQAEYVDHFDRSLAEKLSADEILKCIDELPTGFRTIFNLYAIEGYSHGEISQLLQIKEASSRSQLARARQLLQNKIQKLYARNES
jgi:RNA polymerase sigma-70 factor (ECF subfamily)